MRIVAQPDSLRREARTLLDLTDQLRTLRRAIEDVRHHLRRDTELVGCCAELARQEESLALITARIVSLSASLTTLSELYSAVEETNTQLLEGNSPHGSGMRAQLSFDMQYYRSRAEAILYEQEA